MEKERMQELSLRALLEILKEKRLLHRAPDLEELMEMAGRLDISKAEAKKFIKELLRMIYEETSAQIERI